MSKGKRNNDCSHCAILPPEIVADVLSRLPVKSLCRFKCVSPSWKTLISSPDFARTHLNRTNTNNPKHFDRNFTLISTTDDLYSVDLAAHVPIATKLDFPPLQQPEQRLSLLGSCHGLLLLSGTGKSNVFWFSQKNIFNLFLLNPSTRECKKLPPLPFVLDPGDRGIYAYGYGMGYDSSTDDYKVVMLSYYVSESESESSPLSDMTIVAVYSVKTSAWRRIQDTHYTLDGCIAGVYYNGCLHWICWWDWSYLMFVFDLADEIFREVPLPTSDEFVDFHKVVIVGDCLCLVCERDSFPLRNSDPVEVWMMKEFGVSALWTKVMIDIHDKSYERYDLNGLLAEDEFLLTGSTLERLKEDKLLAYNPKKGKLRDIMVHGIPTTFYTRRTYVESLVSPN